MGDQEEEEGEEKHLGSSEEEEGECGVVVGGGVDTRDEAERDGGPSDFN